MWLDLKEIIEVPGASLDFSCELDEEALAFPALERFAAPPRAKGRVRNSAGILTLTGEITADMLCVCDRCGKVFPYDGSQSVSAVLSADPDDEDDSEVFPIIGDGIDPGEVLATCFILNMDAKFLCRDDCKGLCPMCGKDLNDGPCTCKKPVDPRWAVLGHLLDNEDNES